jgi:hypothetical protein
LEILYQASFVSNGFFQQDFKIMLQIILWNCGWSAVETVDFNRERLKCGWKFFSRVSTASTAFQPSQEISDEHKEPISERAPSWLASALKAISRTCSFLISISTKSQFQDVPAALPPVPVVRS